MIYDLAILGGGPAGVAAGVYASRKRLSTVFITANFESQSFVSDDIQNWIGTVSISGQELTESLRKHLEHYAEDVVKLQIGEYVKEISKKDKNFVITTDKGAYEARAILIATGSIRKKLTIPGAAEYENKGLTYCASCDGPIFADKDVIVVGGGNAGFETAAQLLAYTKSVTLLHRDSTFKADAVTVQKVVAHPNMRALTDIESIRIDGDKFVTSYTFKNSKTGEETTLPVQGVFVEIGALPNTEFAKNVVKINEYNQIVVDPRTQMSSTPGIWAAGDCTDGLYHQNNIAAGDAVKALEDIYLYLKA
ncbi:MAG TPA: FAD-dependent oxidoreductase [Candidatus Nanoarchaeia archaeon]|nr:FAD-dependent oxidoreductase [Candidatus Nanoarchaeia archaeon]